MAARAGRVMETMGRGRPPPAPISLRWWRATVPAMNPHDFATLATFLYGPTWHGRLSDDTGMRADNMRRLVDGRRGIPPALAEFLLRRAADRWLLRAYADRPPPAGLSRAIAAELDARILDARQWRPPDQPGTPPQGSEDP